jgi:hypothetical protein
LTFFRNTSHPEAASGQRSYRPPFPAPQSSQGRDVCLRRDKQSPLGLFRLTEVNAISLDHGRVFWQKKKYEGTGRDNSCSVCYSRRRGATGLDFSGVAKWLMGMGTGGCTAARDRAESCASHLARSVGHSASSVNDEGSSSKSMLWYGRKLHLQVGKSGRWRRCCMALSPCLTLPDIDSLVTAEIPTVSIHRVKRGRQGD